MALYHFECHKCTNKYVGPDGSIYCKPTVDAFMKKIEPFSFTWDWHDGSGKNAEAWCEYYTVEPKQTELYPMLLDRP